MIEPVSEYETRRFAWVAKLSLLQRELNQLGNARLALALLAALIAWLAYGPGAISEWWLALPLLAIFVLFVRHSRLTRRRAFAERGLRYYDRALNRVNDSWHGKGESGERFRDPNHVYAEDLDIFGKGGLFELLCTARTAAGEDVLADWLLHPATREDAAARQIAVRELSTRLDLREDIALLGEDIRSQVRADLITRWGALPPIPFPSLLRPLAAALSIAALALSIAFILQRIPLWPLALVFAINSLLVYLTRPIVTQILSSVDTPASHLAILSLLIERVSQETFASPLLQQWIEQLQVAEQSAAAQIKRLERLIEWLGAEPHPLIKVIQHVLLWRLQIALAIELWRRQSGSHLSEWIRVLAEFEAISALASLAYERPAWSFPEFVSTSTQAGFTATAMRHPLMAEDRCVPNELTLNPSIRLLIVSGSNMSGKSTLLRSIGLNTVLAWAGAPVAASRLQLTPLQTGASIRVTDSLQDNRSRFFAEITRLRQIVDLTRASTPVVFLLDELLSGTNSHDRRIGAGGLIQGLLRGNTIGLITTHDLALADIATGLTHATNVHFEDHITEGKMVFDYQLRPGVVTHSNALELMRAVGLNV